MGTSRRAITSDTVRQGRADKEKRRMRIYFSMYQQVAGVVATYTDFETREGQPAHGRITRRQYAGDRALWYAVDPSDTHTSPLYDSPGKAFRWLRMGNG